MEPLISVIVPVYKVEPYLRKCVDSILNQTYTNLEVILVDDGSPDNCGAICDEYAAKDNRVTVIHKENGGLSDARNAGMAQSKGEYLCFVDSDDLLPKKAIKTLVDTACSEKVQIVIGEHKRFDDEPGELSDTTAVQYLTPTEAMAEMFRNGCASWARLYRKEIHQDILFPVGEINEDEAIVLRLLERGERIAVTSAVVYYYRCRPESITTTNFSEKKLAWVKHCKDNLKYIQERHPELEREAAARYRSSIMWAMREIALSDKSFVAETRELKAQLKDKTVLFAKAPFKNRGERLRYGMMRYLPFGLSKNILRLRHRV